MRFGSLFDATQTMVSQVSLMISMRYRLFHGMTTRTPTPAQMVRTIKYFAELA